MPVSRCFCLDLVVTYLIWYNVFLTLTNIAFIKTRLFLAQLKFKNNVTQKGANYTYKIDYSGVKSQYLATKWQDVDWATDSAKSIDGFAYDARFQRQLTNDDAAAD